MRTGPLHHLAVCVRDLERARAFYVDLLGLAVREEHRREDGTLRSLWLDLGDAFLAIEEGPAGGARRADHGPGWHCVALSIAPSEREEWRARLASAGHPVERESDYTLYVRDPEGALLALSHYPERAP
jgi:glyoxylase I family protein